MTNLPKVDVVGVGLNATDTLIPVPHFPERGSRWKFIPRMRCWAGKWPRPWPRASSGACARVMSARSARTMPRRSTARNSSASASKRIFLPRPRAPASRPSSSSIKAVERTVLWKRDPRLTLLPEELDREWIVNARVLHLDGHDTAAATLAANGHAPQEFPLSRISTISTPAMKLFCPTSIS